MFGWKDRDTKAVYKFKFLAFLPLFASLIVFCYLIGNVFILSLTNRIVCFCYPFGFRFVYILTPFNSFANYPTITLFTVFLIAVFVASWVLFTAFAWDIHFVAVLKSVEGYERYGDVKTFVRVLMKGDGRKKLMVILGPILFLVVFLLTTAWILSWVILYSEQITSTFFWLLLSAALLNVLYTFIMEGIYQEKCFKIAEQVLIVLMLV